MKFLKYALLMCGLAGAAGCFLPFIPGETASYSFWGLRFLQGNIEVFLVVAAYGATALVGLAAIVHPPMTRFHALLALGGYGWIIYKIRGRIDQELFAKAIGGKLMAVALVAGLLVCLAALVKPDSR